MRMPKALEQQLTTFESKTEVGSYFISNYPPFSAWSSDGLPSVNQLLDSPATEGQPVPLGLYLHIPFCRKRCKFCYFRVYTDKNARDVDDYLAALAKEISCYAHVPRLAGRRLDFVYFGGGTPSFLSNDQLTGLVERISEDWSWQDATEVTFECEPGTLKKSKLQTLHDIGVTRLSLGIEHFDDQILTINGRAHKSPEVFASYDWAREVGFHQINIDLIAGMIGDTDDKWKKSVELALAMKPDSLTVYQMELPHNSVVAIEADAGGSPMPVADWPTKRAWVDHAFTAFAQEGYVQSSAYTVVKPSPNAPFYYRDALWRGADMLGTGVASFSHLSGTHYQNVDRWEDYLERLQQGELPLSRAFVLSQRQKAIREFILQLKLGRVDPQYFQAKFDMDIGKEFADQFESLAGKGLLTRSSELIELSRQGLLRVDGLLPHFFEPEYRNIRYT